MGNVAYGSRLCENSDVQLSRRTFVSITLNMKRTALADAIERRKERKQFCSFSARTRFHTAWVKNGLGSNRTGYPLLPQKQTKPNQAKLRGVWVRKTRSALLVHPMVIR